MKRQYSSLFKQLSILDIKQGRFQNMVKLTKPIEKWKLSKNVMSTHVIKCYKTQILCRSMDAKHEEGRKGKGNANLVLLFCYFKFRHFCLTKAKILDLESDMKTLLTFFKSTVTSTTTTTITTTRSKQTNSIWIWQK